MISSLEWQFVEDYNFYVIEYVLDGYFHRIQTDGRNVNTDIPTFISENLRAEINCEPIEKVYR